MYSLNVPVPGDVQRLAAELHPRLTAFDTVRERHTLVAKRLGDDSLDRLRERLRRPLRDLSPFEARVTGLDVFERPTRGTGPVVYLAVESPGLVALHERLVDAFGTVAGLEGDDYTPHVTLGRGGSFDGDALASLSDRVEPVAWTVSELAVYDSRYRETVSRLSLPA